MKNILVALILFLLTAPLLFAGNAMRPERPENPLEGKPAPSAYVYDAYSRPMSLSKLRGKPTLLVFFLPGDASPLTEVEQLLQDHSKAKIAGLAIAIVRGGGGGKRKAAVASSISPQIIQQLAQIRTPLTIAIDTGEASREYMARPGTVVLIDEQWMVRVHAIRLDRQRDRIEDLLEVFAGEAPDMFGWRSDLIFAMDIALGRRDRTGKRLIPGKGKGVAPPEQGIRELRLAIPPTELNIKANYDMAPEPVRSQVKEAVEHAKKEWEKAVPGLKLAFVEDRDEADLILNFMTEVLDPRDPNGLRTVCSHMRTLDEEAPGKGKMDGKRPSQGNEHRVKTIANLGFGHTLDRREHSQRAIAHMAAAAIGYALGLDDRNDSASVMQTNVDQGQPVLTPSRQDLAILRNLAPSLYFQIGKMEIERGRTRQAQEAFDKIPSDSRYAQLAREALRAAEDRRVRSGSNLCLMRILSEIPQVLD